MVQIEALAQSWQERHQSTISPFSVGRRVQNLERLFSRIITAAVVVGIAMFADGFVTNLLPGKIAITILCVSLIVITAAMVASTLVNGSEQVKLWREFQRCHDVLVSELDILAASTSLSDLISRTNKRLEKKSGEILKEFRLYTPEKGETALPTVAEADKLHAKVVDYWSFHNAGKYLGLLDEAESPVSVVDSTGTRLPIGRLSRGNL